MNRVRKAIGDYLKKLDKLLVLLALTLSAFGVAVIYSATHNVSNRSALVQMLGIGLGFVLMIIVSCFDYHTLMKMWKIYAPLCLLLMILTYVVGYQPAG